MFITWYSANLQSAFSLPEVVIIVCRHHSCNKEMPSAVVVQAPADGALTVSETGHGQSHVSAVHV